jgi:hypothetical protein
MSWSWLTMHWLHHGRRDRGHRHLFGETADARVATHRLR